MHRPIHGLHAALLAGQVPLFLGVLFCDLAYANTFEIQWKNFSSWLLVGALVFAGCALVWSIIDTWLDRVRPMVQIIYAATLLLIWILGFINALLHSADAAASLSAALVISWIVAVLAIGVTWLGFGGLRRGVKP